MIIQKKLIDHHMIIPAIRDFIQDELPTQKAICDSMPDDRNRDWTALNRCFADVIGVEIRRSE